MISELWGNMKGGGWKGKEGCYTNANYFIPKLFLLLLFSLIFPF